MRRQTRITLGARIQSGAGIRLEHVSRNVQAYSDLANRCLSPAVFRVGLA